jgi:lysozyme
MEMSEEGLTRLVEREGMRRNAYRDVAGIWTICVGHTSAAGPPKVTPGMKCTLAECRKILMNDVRKFEKCVEDAITVPMKQHQFDAMVSLAYNIGCGAFKKSTVAREMNAGHETHAADAFRMWKKAGGKVVAGLVNRRESERNQFNGKSIA